MATPINFTTSSIDRLGQRLREGHASEADITLLDSYRRSFRPAYDEVVEVVRDRLALEPTGRPAKSTASIVEKLRRETIRLSQMQDIAGCRVVVTDSVSQDDVVAQINAFFLEASVVDRREKPSFGYRAVHVVPRIGGRLVEIQVRTSLQHLWAELSEKIADVMDHSIKYGGGHPSLQRPILELSNKISILEMAGRRDPSTVAKRAIVETLLTELIASVSKEEERAS